MSAKRKPSALQREIEDFIRAMDLGSGAKFWLPEICRLAMRHAVPEGCVVVPLSLVERTEDFLRATYPAGNLVRDWTKLLAAAKEKP